MSGDNPPAEESDADVALALMREWSWHRLDEDMKERIQMLPLHEAIAQLAMDGIRMPHEAVLALLYEGRLVALGDWAWRKYEYGEFYQLEGQDGIIKSDRWNKLAIMVDEKSDFIFGNSWESLTVNLKNLDMLDCERVDWAFRHDRFSTAMREPEDESLSVDYEEWFSAWSIHVCPRSVYEPDVPEPTAEPVLTGAKRGGAPRKWDWDGALLHLAAKAHHSADGLYRDDGSDPNQSDIARHLEAWFMAKHGNAPEQSQLRAYGARFLAALAELKAAAANNPGSAG
jgi:hypothetical protein